MCYKWELTFHFSCNFTKFACPFVVISFNPPCIHCPVVAYQHMIIVFCKKNLKQWKILNVFKLQ